MNTNHRQPQKLRRLQEPLLRFVGLVLLAAGCGPARAASEEPKILANLSLDQLSQIQVIAVSRREESLANTPAAVYVLQTQDILRSGASSVAEALRWVPGLDVAQVNAAQWGVSSRGFNGTSANKLLVMVDGRSVYTPLLAGVFWENLTPMLEDLERIEVVRGPGGTMWGANAVNGVISIRSKSAKDTQGGLAYGGGGTESLASGGARYGFTLSDKTWMRVYTKYDLGDDSVLADGKPGNDSWDQSQTGFRIDSEPSDPNKLTLQGDFYNGRRERVTPLITPAGVVRSEDDLTAEGANVLGRWTHEFEADSKLTLQAYYDQSRRESPQVDENRDTFDVDIQQDWRVSDRHLLTFGLGYRWSGDRTTPGVSGGFVPAKYDFGLASAFVQDEITLVEDRLRLTLGNKFEHNSFTGLEIQPGARLLWTPSQRQTFWAGVARAVRNPNRADTGISLDSFYVPPGPNASNTSPFPVLLRAIGNPDIRSETMIAYEAGWRTQLSPRLSFDVATFFNDYDRLILGIPDTSATFLETSPAPAHLVNPFVLQNAAKAVSYGGELSLVWTPVDNLRVAPFYSYLHVAAEKTTPGDRSLASIEESSPEHQIGIRAGFDLTANVLLDLNLRWIGDVPAYSVPDYFEADLRVAWKISKALELAVTGQNLLHDNHNEFGPLTIESRYYLERKVAAKLTWFF